MIKAIIWLVIGIVLGITGTVSGMQTQLSTLEMDFPFWWSVVSTLAGIALVFFSLWQYWEAESLKKANKSQIKIWMECAKGVVDALSIVRTVNYTELSDMRNSISIIETSANVLYQTLYQDRVALEEVYVKKEKEIFDLTTKQTLTSLTATKDQVAKVAQNEISSAKKLKSTEKVVKNSKDTNLQSLIK